MYLVTLKNVNESLVMRFRTFTGLTAETWRKMLEFSSYGTLKIDLPNAFVKVL